MRKPNTNLTPTRRRKILFEDRFSTRLHPRIMYDIVLNKVTIYTYRIASTLSVLLFRKIMGRVLLLVSLAVLFFCACIAEASHCRNVHRPISCCADSRVVRKNGEWIMQCKKCDSGYKPSSSKEQCLPKKDCKKGYGPGPMGLNEDQCIKCSDKNCKYCTQVFYDCTECKNNYLLDPQGACQPRLLL